MAAATKPTNEEIIKMLEQVLHELSELKKDLAKLARSA